MSRTVYCGIICGDYSRGDYSEFSCGVYRGPSCGVQQVLLRSLGWDLLLFHMDSTLGCTRMPTMGTKRALLLVLR
eukprot:1297914-Lingulodinium_polyedra.AAC.1